MSRGHAASGAADRAVQSVRQAFTDACASPQAPTAGQVLVLAVSGGLDSIALLHLARFAWPEGRAPERVVAHFDHRMRAGSDADARWLRGICAAWGFRLVTGEAGTPPVSEAEARARRYAFLHQVRRDVGASHVATAHHADDQAETVLFRILRGTGPTGLRGISELREDGIWRPLLALWREELEAYARASALAWRDDPTNEALTYARNALRHRILPEAETLVAPGARRALVRLAEVTAFDEEGWESLIPGLLASLAPDRRGPGVRVDREALASYHPAVRARLLRALTAELGFTPDADQTERAVAFVVAGESGRSLELGDGVLLRRELDRLALVRPEPGSVPDDRPLVIPGAGPGQGDALLAGRAIRVRWGARIRPGEGTLARFHTEALRFPLSVRAWQAGDRMRTLNGVRKLKRVFLEARVPAPERRSLPVLADAEGEVLWIPGVARARAARAPADAADEDVLPVVVV